MYYLCGNKTPKSTNQNAAMNITPSNTQPPNSG